MFFCLLQQKFRDLWALKGCFKVRSGVQPRHAPATGYGSPSPSAQGPEGPAGPAFHSLSPLLPTPGSHFRQHLSCPTKAHNTPGIQFCPMKTSASLPSLWTRYTRAKEAAVQMVICLLSSFMTHLKLETPILLTRGHFFKATSYPHAFFPRRNAILSAAKLTLLKFPASTSPGALHY